MAKRKEVTDAQIWAHEERMKAWRYNYPFGHAVMSGKAKDLTEQQVSDLVKIGKERRSKGGVK